MGVAGAAACTSPARCRRRGRPCDAAIAFRHITSIEDRARGALRERAGQSRGIRRLEQRSRSTLRIRARRSGKASSTARNPRRHAVIIANDRLQSWQPVADTARRPIRRTTPEIVGACAASCSRVPGHLDGPTRHQHPGVERCRALSGGVNIGAMRAGPRPMASTRRRFARDEIARGVTWPEAPPDGTGAVDPRQRPWRAGRNT